MPDAHDGVGRLWPLWGRKSPRNGADPPDIAHTKETPSTQSLPLFSEGTGDHPPGQVWSDDISDGISTSMEANCLQPALTKWQSETRSRSRLLTRI